LGCVSTPPPPQKKKKKKKTKEDVTHLNHPSKGA
jgi:hypothetical protein